MSIRLLILLLIVSTSSCASECFLDKEAIEIIKLNNLNSLKVEGILKKHGLYKQDYMDNKGIYLPENFNYSAEELPTLDGVLQTHTFESKDFSLYYVEKKPALLSDLREITNKDKSAFELLKHSLNYFGKSSVEYCEIVSLKNYLYYSNIFLHRSASKIDFGYGDDVIVSVRNNNFGSFKFIVNHENPNKVWEVSLINN